MNATMSFPRNNTPRFRRQLHATRLAARDAEVCWSMSVGMDIGESLGGYWFIALRCVQCGDIIDEVILRNRYAHLVATQDVVRAA